MKVASIFLLILAVSSPAFAVTPYQRKMLREVALQVMLKQGAESELAPKVGNLTILDENGSLVAVKFSGIEWGPYEYKCAFSYDFGKGALVPGSDFCE